VYSSSSDSDPDKGVVSDTLKSSVKSADPRAEKDDPDDPVEKDDSVKKDDPDDEPFSSSSDIDKDSNS
jgi:hypothetical protein